VGSPARSVFAVALLVSAPSFAATTDANHSAAVESFRRGTQLVEAGKLQEAVDAFRDALQREPASVGARLDLADCYEKIGTPASAWREYVIAEAYARKAGDARQSMARTSAAGLESRLLLVRLLGPNASAPVELRVDGDLVAEEIVRRGSIAVAPGQHRVALAAPGKKPLSEEITGAAGETRALAVVLEDEVSLPPPVRDEPAPASPAASSQKTWGLVLGGAGLAALGAGAVFGGVAVGKKSSLEAESNDPSVGAARFYGDRSNADNLATVSTVSLITGGVALAAGVVLVATAPRSRQSGWLRFAPSVGRGAVGAMATGEF
jgi:hypothetical protein